MRASHSPGCSRACASPSARSSSSDITCGSEKVRRPSMSNTMILRRPGVRSRTARILSSCSSSSTNRILGVAVVDEILDLRRRIGRIDAGRDARPRTARRDRRTATPCCCRRGWRRARPAAARARSAPSRSPWPPRRTGPRCRPSRCRDPSRACATLSGPRVAPMPEQRPAPCVEAVELDDRVICSVRMIAFMPRCPAALTLYRQRLVRFQRFLPRTAVSFWPR